MSRFIFVTGGVVSSLGKGIATASLALLLGLRGFRVKAKKFDPYFNIDSGTMSPGEHGEVFVTNDGAETDLDIGHYERFTGNDAVGRDSVTMGKVLFELLRKERQGGFLGETVQAVPHATDIVKNFITCDAADFDFTICEIGGTAGDIEALTFFEAVRQLRYELGAGKTMFLHVTLLPYLQTTGELKTKPTQHSVKELRSIGIQPDMLLCRAQQAIGPRELQKMALMCSVAPEMVIPALNAQNIYEVPLVYHRHKFDDMVTHYFNLPHAAPDLEQWQGLVEAFNNPEHHIKVALVGKYARFGDAYISVIEALNHGGIAGKIKVEVVMVDSRTLDEQNAPGMFEGIDAILVPGGFGAEGINGKMIAIKHARENKVPFLGICLGMQLAVIEIARNTLGVKDAISTEFSEQGTVMVGLMEEWIGAKHQVEKRNVDSNKGGTMRLGLYECSLQTDSLAYSIYQKTQIKERHRHRYEINNNYVELFKQHGAIFSGTSAQGSVLEILELQKDAHPWFVATQFHPELRSKAFLPHPLFINFTQAGLKYKRSAINGKSNPKHMSPSSKVAL